jgi:hypothetical protein
MVARKTCIALFSLLFALTILTACTDEEAEPGGEMVIPNNPRAGLVIEATEQPLVKTGDLATDALAALDGYLVFQQGTSLYSFTEPASQQPRLLAENVYPGSVRRSAAGRHLYFISGPEDDPVLYRLDPRSLESVRLVADLPAGDLAEWAVLSISPDEEWVVLDVTPTHLTIARLDGSEVYAIPETPGNYAPVWLDDGSVLLVEWEHFGPSSEPDFRYVGAYRYRPGWQTLEQWSFVDNEQPGVDFVLNAPPPWQANLAENSTVMRVARNQGFQALPPAGGFQSTGFPLFGQIVPHRDFEGPATPCLDWQIIQRYTPANVLYIAEGVFMLTDLQPLPDNAMLFLEWRLPGCTIGYPEIALKRLEENGTVQTVIEGIFPGLDPAEPDPSIQRYRLTPDAEAVIWLGGHPERGQSSLNVTHLSSGETVTLVRAGSAGEQNDLIRDMFILRRP